MRPDSAQSKFPLEISLRGGCYSRLRWGPHPHRSPPARIFAEQKCLAADKVSQICCSAGRSSDILQTSKTVHTRKRVLPKYVEDARLGGHCKSGTPGISKGPQPFCFRKSPEKTLLKGFLWATSSRRLDTALLCAAKKRGVESPGWQVSASLNWRLPRNITQGSADPCAIPGGLVKQRLPCRALLRF